MIQDEIPRIECNNDECFANDVQVTQLRSDCGDNAGELERRQIRINECEAQIEKLVEKGDWHEAERRRLHNTIQVRFSDGLFLNLLLVYII